LRREINERIFARLLGLYPKEDQQTHVLIAPAAVAACRYFKQIEFAVPARREPEPPRYVPPEGPRLLPPPSPTRQPIMRRNAWGDWEEVK
jgi:hypothetical protein